MGNTDIILPTLFPAQAEAYRVFRSSRRTAIRCGRRWGKTDFGKVIACDSVIRSKNIGWFAPDYKIQSEAFSELAATLDPIKKSSSKVDGLIRTTTNGRIDFWTLENERAGRSRKYHGIIIDEGAFGKDNVTDIWEKSIEPTLLDYQGWALVLSNTNGVDPANFFYRICTDPKYGFTEYHAPTSTNPYMPVSELERLKREKHPLVWRQEYLAEFVDFSGTAFFLEEWLLENGQPVPYPTVCDSVFAVMDTAVKTGSSNDGTAVSYWASSQFVGHPLVCLDWDLIQIDGAMLETWIPTVRKRLEDLSRECRARFGVRGIFIEDAQSGSILLQQCAMRGIPAEALPQTQTSLGKDGRAWNASGAVSQGKVKWSRYAFDKPTVFKGTSRNHMLAQVYGFRLGDKDAAKRSDDLLDTFCYAVIVALGNSEGVT